MRFLESKRLTVRMRNGGFLTIVLLALAGCATTRHAELQRELDRPGTHLNSEHGQSIIGYVDNHGHYHGFRGTVRLVPGDSLEFATLLNEFVYPKSNEVARRFVLPRDSVVTIDIQHTDPVLATLAVVGSVGAILGIGTLIALSTKESCPFIYTWDGTQYVFDGEPYGGAIARALERSDCSELEHLVPDHGIYRLQLTNEVDETQHTNSLQLVVVDHPRGTTVVMDKEGRPHALRRIENLAAARDQDGADLLPWLRANDRVSWYPDLAALARQDSLADTRSHITLEFRRPPAGARVYLVSTVATGQWGSHMLRSILGMRGDQVQAFYAGINGSDANREQLLQWNRREELYEMFPEVRIGDRWVRQDFIQGGGPFVSENRALPLNLEGLRGDRVQVRINPPIGFWSLNAFRLAWDEAEAHVTTLQPASGAGPEGVDVRARLRQDDNLYLDFPSHAEHAQLTYTVPPRRAGSVRTVFARTRGWYEIHLHDLAAPDARALARLTGEPGYPVRHALREYAEYRRTGALKGVAAAASGGR